MLVGRSGDEVQEAAVSYGGDRIRHTLPREHNCERALTGVARTVLLMLASAPTAAQHNHRRAIRVDRAKVRNPALFPTAFDNVLSDITDDARESNLSWTQTVGSSEGRLAMVSMPFVPTSVMIAADAGSSTTFSNQSSDTTNYTVRSGSNTPLVLSVCIRNGSSHIVTASTNGAPRYD
jgi:hypothetical protein